MTIIDSDLDWLEHRGHRVDRVPTVVNGRAYYYIDGVPRTPEQIVRYIVERVPLAFEFESPSGRSDRTASY